MKKLMPMVDYVLYIMDTNSIENYLKNGLLYDYAHFLKQPLTLGMFVPCDLEGNVLEYLSIFGFIENIGGIASGATELDHDKHEAYQQAEERVLFKEVEIVQAQLYYQCSVDIETLLLITEDLELTEAAIKKLK